MIRLQPTPNDFQNSFNSPRNNLDLTNNTSIGNFSQIPSQNIPSSMYQTAASSQYQQPSFLYGNQSITYTSNNNHSRSSSAASFSRQSPTDGSFGFEANGYSQLNYNRYDQSTNTGSTMNSQPDVKASSLEVQTSPHMIPSSATSSATLSPDSGLKVLPPLSEVFPQSTTLSGQSSNSTAPSPTQSQVVQVQTQQQQQQAANAAAAVAAAQNGFFQSIQYPDAASYTADGATYGSATQGSLMSQAQQQSLGQQAAALSQQTQIASNIPVVDPRTLPRLGGATASDLQQAGIQTAAMLDPTRRGSNALLAINTGLTVGSEQSPLSAGSSTGSPIVTGVPGATLNYQHPAAAHQALLNSHFMAAAQSMNNSGMLASSHRSLNGRKGYRPEDDMNSTGERPQKVYSFVALPGINTKKRPRRRYDEIERHYACNYPGCTKSYGTLNHLNAHVQMQKHGPKRHPSEFKELRKQWRRQKREEEERKAAEAAAAKNSVGLNISLPSI
ncbi:5755_t:CDS:2 [Funneliformis mosseae]|uniref:5755_t:CDS:1 n=1 Tax=Funneliformis mosseae TaxID=27381 RepID=A0A9N9AYW0_FUNMO|nr:5755_t:CDS:2 [Funneliformis mosseae]